MSDFGETLRMSTPPPATTGPRLLFLNGERRGEVVPLVLEVTKIGRLKTADLVLESGLVSKEHCLIQKSDGIHYLQDLESKNGVSINGTRVAHGTGRRLANGDQIGIAEYLLLFQQTACFGDADGGSRIQIDRNAVTREAEEILAGFQRWRAELAGRPALDPAAPDGAAADD